MNNSKKVYGIPADVNEEDTKRFLENTGVKTKEDGMLFSMLPHMNLFSENAEKSYLDENIVSTRIITDPSDGYRFLHEAALIEYKGCIFAAWYNCQDKELDGATPIRWTKTRISPEKWDEPHMLVFDANGKLLYCPPVFGVCDGKLYMFINSMVSPDHIHSLDLYVYEETRGEFAFMRSEALPFKLNTNVYTLSNGKLILPGRIAPEIDEFPSVPAVLISDSGKTDTKWRLVKIMNDRFLPDKSNLVHCELSLIECGGRLYAFSRNDLRNVPIVFVSNDFGETWSEPVSHDIPFSAAKIYSGTLSDGRNYLIGNKEPGRNELDLYVSEKNSMEFTKAYVLQNAKNQKLGLGNEWIYPAAHEADGKLYIICTVGYDGVRRAAVMSLDTGKI